MVPDFVLHAVASLGPDGRGQSGRDEAQRLPALRRGDSITALVESKLPDGSFRVVVAGQSLRMQLPANIVPGETLDLELLAREPLSFALRGTSATDPAPVLSRGAELISTLLSDAPAAARQPLEIGIPALAGPTIDAETLSGALQRTLRQSGLFYESHQAQWLQGRISNGELEQEPQARVARRDPVRGAVDAQTLPLVQRQIALLDSGRVTLQLELWPGQRIGWEIEERRTDEKAAEERLHERNPRTPEAAAIPRDWRTRLRFELPMLGPLEAVLSLNAQSVAVRIDADQPESAELLGQQAPGLQDRLAAAGIAARALEIRSHAAV